ncbi:rhombiod family peptidase protein [Rhizobium phaseoli]|uniref:rhomboid family intramembrane serine protease n=1 Tax=Rhizobium phaseoli TaxID=396 RepID=UPI0007EA531D|nr:rhomboid family intramembrane serine protease [Rhizobium phaseoli]ANL66231.1 rhombiod family peptidase protein [Rhizobium phaseoli]ANL72616.1 rhombiod family peptidase protein [Rhizobium phaseoli]ANL79044.1 rhombiod family peptidase protein [Rhizobium phaseoli]
MKPEELRRSEYAVNKWKLLLIFLIMATFAAGSVWLGFYPPKDKDPRLGWLLGSLGAMLFGLIALLLLRGLISSGPGLVMSTEGIRLPYFPGQLLPWSAIRSFDRVQGKNIDNIILHLDPIFAGTLRRRGLLALLPEWLIGSRAKVGIALRFLQGNPNSIANEFLELSSKAREAERQADALEGPVADEVEEVPRLTLNGLGHPVFTYLLIAVLVAIYVGEISFGVDPPAAGSPSTQTLVVLGGTFFPRMTAYGEWWRLFTAPLMHGGLTHLGFNCVSLWIAGRLFERLIGWRWFAGIFFASALGGSLASVWINDPHIVGVGASGGIVGLFAAVVAASFRFRSTPIADSLRIGAAQILIPSLLPILSAAKEGESIDYAAHFGGALTGAALSLLLLAFWPRQRPSPRFGAAGVAFGAVFIMIATASLRPIINSRQLFLYDPLDHYFAGNYHLSAAGFSAKATIDPKNAPYYNLWHFFAQTREGNARAQAELKMAGGWMDHAAWPYPVYQLFLGELKPEDVMARAADSNQRCEAVFYTGEWYLLGGNTKQARRNFQSAFSSCPTTFLEYEGAKGELKNLGAQ